MAELQQIIPRPGEIRPDKPYRTPDQRWEEVTKLIYGSSEEPQNIFLVHDVDWDRHFWSIQNAHDQVAWMIPGQDNKTSRRRSFGFWTVVALLMAVSDAGWMWFRIR